MSGADQIPESGIASPNEEAIVAVMRFLFLGDIVGRPGREAVRQHIADIRAQQRLDLVIANGENSAGGSGINREIAIMLHEAGVDGITLGDHCWDQRGFDKDIEELPFVCRPFNLLANNPGRRHLILQAAGYRLAVVTVLGQQLMKIDAEPGFSRIVEYAESLRAESDGLLVEMHAETTSEKVAMGWHMDGRAVAVLGTHTHIPTADCRRLPRGTGYISDVGMCGPYDSVIGREIGPVLGRFLDAMPRKFEIASGNVQLLGVIVEVEAGRRGCVQIEPFRFDQVEE